MITFEKSLSSYDAYFSYEEKLNLHDPILHNMVSKRYRCADHEEEDLDSVSDIDEDEETEVISDFLPRQELTLSDVLEYATTEKNSEYEFMFGSFNSEIVPIKPIKTIQPKIEGSAIKIGEIRCFFNNEKQICVGKTLFDLANSELVLDLKCCEFSEIDHSVFDHHRADFGIPSEIKNSRRFWFDLISFTSDLNHSSLFDFEKSPSAIIVPLPEMSVEHAVLVCKTPQRSAFAFDPGGTGTIPPCVEIAVFDPGGANLISTAHHFHGLRSAIVISISSFSKESVVDPVDLSLGFSRIQRRSCFIFDPGGVPAVSTARRFLHDFQKPQEHSVLVFDPGGIAINHHGSCCYATFPPLISLSLSRKFQKFPEIFASCPHCFCCAIQVLGFHYGTKHYWAWAATSLNYWAALLPFVGLHFVASLNYWAALEHLGSISFVHILVIGIMLVFQAACGDPTISLRGAVTDNNLLVS